MVALNFQGLFSGFLLCESQRRVYKLSLDQGDSSFVLRHSHVTVRDGFSFPQTFSTAAFCSKTATFWALHALLNKGSQLLCYVTIITHQRRIHHLRTLDLCFPCYYGAVHQRQSQRRQVPATGRRASRQGAPCVHRQVLPNHRRLPCPTSLQSQPLHA